MNRYIDADALKDKMFNYYSCVNRNTGKDNYKGETLMNYEVADMIEDCIDNAPTADVQEVKHGHWIGKPISGYADCKCSVCGAICNVHASVGIPTQRFCPKCGAKIDLEEKNDGETN